MNLSPLRELEPTTDEIARARRRAAEPPPARRSRPAMAAVAVLAAAGIAVVAALPGGDTAASALRAAAAAAADKPGPTDFTGYRYVDMLEHRRAEWAVLDQECMDRHGLPLPATPGTGPKNVSKCPVTARASYEEQGRQELWVDARWAGTRRDHGTRLTRVDGDRQLEASLRRELGRKPSTTPYEYGEGPFARAPLADLPTDPDALLRTLSEAYADNRWGEGGTLATDSEAARRYELASFAVHLLAESNATPALRGAVFRMLAGMPDVVDLGTIEDSRGRRGHGIEVRGVTPSPEAESATLPARLRVIFDPDAGEVLAWSRDQHEQFVEYTLVRTAHVRERPQG